MTLWTTRIFGKAVAIWLAASALCVSVSARDTTSKASVAEAREREATARASSKVEARRGALEEMRRLEADLTAVADRVMDSFVFIQGGSGFLISEDGYILTNEHVVARPGGGLTSEVIVTFRRGKQLRADVVGHDPGGDVALLKLRKPPGRPALEFGNSDALDIGQRVIAVGDPFLVGSEERFLRLAPPDYEPAVSLGVVSALHRYSEGYPDAIQVDAAVNPGNSGGPLLTLDGKVVGINGKIENPFGVGINAGIGYAVPINQIKRFLEPLKQADGGVVRHGGLPGLSVGRRAGRTTGLPVEGVKPGSAADRFGFKRSDRLLTLAGHPITTVNRFNGVVLSYPEGSELTARVLRAGKTLELPVVLYANDRPYLGVEIDRTDEGLRIASVVKGGPAARAGVRGGDLVRSLGDKETTSADDLRQALEEKHPGSSIRAKVERDGKALELDIVLGSHPRSS